LQRTDSDREFEAIVREHSSLLYKICRLYARTDDDRQDLFQEIVIQLWKSYPSYKGNAQLSTWLYRVALNTAITGIRKEKKRVVGSTPADEVEHLREETYDRTVDDQLEQMYTAIALLGELDRAIVMLYMEDKSYEEMEDILGIAQGTLRVKMSRIKDKLRDLTKQ
jgi:RNA polymerase sigma-70 factor, ECF subfamily